MSNQQPNTINPSLETLVADCVAAAQQAFTTREMPRVIVSPYRINPIGAHIDHQGGSVLARTIDQYTILAFFPGSEQAIVELAADHDGCPHRLEFRMGDTTAGANWEGYIKGAAAALGKSHTITNGFRGYVHGTLIGAGLSSSASVILAYLVALADANSLHLSAAELVEFCRQVEHDYMGLNNGIQDQMSVVFGQSDSLSMLDVLNVSATQIPDPGNRQDVCWVLCYSGFSRELVSSGFNDRVQECRQAAMQLDPQAQHLGEVAMHRRSAAHLAGLSPMHARRARHVYEEMDRVAAGAMAWQGGDWPEFGRIMNASCHSSVSNYGNGMQPMIDLQAIAGAVEGVFGSRFGGGGFGGCLIMLVASEQADEVCENVLEAYLNRYPEKRGIARALVANPEQNVRLI